MQRKIYLRWNTLENGDIEILVDEPVSKALFDFLKSKKYKVKKKEAIPASELLSKPALISLKFQDKDYKAQALIDKWTIDNA